MDLKLYSEHFMWLIALTQGIWSPEFLKGVNLCVLIDQWVNLRDDFIRVILSQGKITIFNSMKTCDFFKLISSPKWNKCERRKDEWIMCTFKMDYI